VIQLATCKDLGNNPSSNSTQAFVADSSLRRILSSAEIGLEVHRCCWIAAMRTSENAVKTKFVKIHPSKHRVNKGFSLVWSVNEQLTPKKWGRSGM
jgi:hypothetical protein